jgi:hypothetical protein
MNVKMQITFRTRKLHKNVKFYCQTVLRRRTLVILHLLLRKRKSIGSK